MSQVFIECDDITINSERILYVKKSVDGGAYIVFLDNQDSITVSGKNAELLIYKLGRVRRSELPANIFSDNDMLSRRKQSAREAHMIPCSRCGRGAMRQGVSYVGPVVCQTCRSKERRVRVS